MTCDALFANAIFENAKKNKAFSKRRMRMTSLMKFSVAQMTYWHNKMLNGSMEALKSQIDISLDQKILNEKWVE